MSNFNGNAALFMTCLVSAIKPDYVIYAGKYQATTFYFGYLTLAYLLIYFTEFTTG